MIAGVIPAAGYATRMQPLGCSKEVYPIAGQPVMDFLVERMRMGGCSELRVVTRPEKTDVIENARRHRAVVIECRPSSPAASILAGVEDLEDDDIVLFGYPDSIWEPLDGFRRLVDLVERGFELVLGLFRSDLVERPDIVRFEDGLVLEIEVGSDAPPPHLIWGCATATARVLRALRDEVDPGDLFSKLCGQIAVGGLVLSDTYVDIGTPEGLRAAKLLRPDPGPPK